MPVATQTRRISISVDTKGSQELKAIADQLGGLNQTTKTLAGSLNFLQSAAAAFIGGLGIKQLADFSDEIQNLNNRLLGLTGSQAEATRLTAQIAQTSRETNSPLAATSELYLKMSLALKDAHLSGKSLDDITKTLVNSFRLSGTSAQEAYGATNNLALAFQLGGLKGRELRAVLRENQVLAQALKKEFGGNLFSAAQDGFITVSKVAEVLFKNMDNINGRAKEMTATFSQSATKALDAFKLKVFEINQALGASGGFASVMDLVVQNMGSIITVGTVIAATTLPAIITGVISLAGALTSLTPAAAILTGGIAVGLAGVVAAFGNSNDIGDLITQMQVGFARLEGIVDDVIAKFYELLVSFHTLIGNTAQGFDKLAAASRAAAKDNYAHAQALEIEHDALKALADQQAKTAEAAARHASDIQKLNDAFVPDLTPTQLLAQLNAQFRAGTIDVAQYNDKLQQVDVKAAALKFRDGKEDLEKFNIAARNKSVYELNQDLRVGTIGFQEYDASIRNIKLDKLNEDLNAGRISVEDYNKSLAGVSAQYSTGGAFRTGLQDYLSAIGSTTQQVAGLITNTFKNVENALFDFIKKGTFSFAQFTQTILDDLLRIIIRMSIISPIATGLLGAFTPTAAANTTPGAGIVANGATPTVNAAGNIYDRGLVKFAAGGVVTTPTHFGFGNGQAGLMGEAGPEAIIPLSRGSGGDLGVKASITPVTINVINQSGNQVEQTATTGPNGEKQIEILVTNKVLQGIATGKYDKVMKNSFGLNRKGT